MTSPTELLKDVPWKIVSRIVHRARMEFFTKEPPVTPHKIYTKESVREMEEALRERHFEGVPYSFNYKGEVLNLRRPIGTDRDRKPEELHVRVIQKESIESVHVIAHTEKSRYEEKDDHINGVDLNMKQGIQMVKMVFDEANLSYVEGV